MTVAEKTEQWFTRRPDSYVPAQTLERLLGLTPTHGRKRVTLNHTMHWGTGILLGCVRGLMAGAGLRGRRASAIHSAVRLTTDQTLENATGVGSPPWTWPRQELTLDVAHKAIYAFVTGAVADALVPPNTERPLRKPSGERAAARASTASTGSYSDEG